MKIGKSSLLFNNVYLNNATVVTGPKEAIGPLGVFFDHSFDDLHANQNTWEKAEEALLEKALEILFYKAKISDKDVDVMIAGDLINQNAISNYVMRGHDIPFIGIYGACSTSVLGMINAAILIDSGNANRVITASSSHYGSAERQYRNPTEYGGAKPLSATSTVTGGATILLENKKHRIKITKATIGRVIDPGLKDANDMGSAMAPAAAETIKAHFQDFNLKLNHYDLILTGDLSSVGKPILIDILKEYDYDISSFHNDAGLMIYDIKSQGVFAGGSGCGCMGVVAMSYIKNQLMNGQLKRVLLVATGALLNPIIINQKETIPCIAHAISLEVEE